MDIDDVKSKVDEAKDLLDEAKSSKKDAGYKAIYVPGTSVASAVNFDHHTAFSAGVFVRAHNDSPDPFIGFAREMAVG